MDGFHKTIRVINNEYKYNISLYNNNKSIYGILTVFSMCAYIPFYSSKIIGRSLLGLSSLLLTGYIYSHFKEQKNRTDKNKFKKFVKNIYKCDNVYNDQLKKECYLEQFNKYIKKTILEESE